MDTRALTESPATGAQPATTAPWRGLAVRAEDLLLAGWIGLAAPVLALTGVAAGPFDSGHPLTGLLLLAGFAGAVACLATRSSDGATGVVASSAGWSVLDSGLVGPLVGGLLLVGGTAFAELGQDPIVAFYPTIVGVLVLSLLRSRLPAVPTGVRRALVTPYLLSAGGIFWGVVHTVAGGIDYSSQFGGSVTGVASSLSGVLGLLILCAAVYYAMLIYAPRQIAEREGGPVTWLVRFGVFVVSVGFGLGWLSLLAG